MNSLFNLDWLDGFMDFHHGATQSEARRMADGVAGCQDRGRITYGTDCFAMARPMLMRLLAITPRPTQRFMPASPFNDSGSDHVGV